MTNYKNFKAIIVDTETYSDNELRGVSVQSYLSSEEADFQSLAFSVVDSTNPEGSVFGVDKRYHRDKLPILKDFFKEKIAEGYYFVAHNYTFDKEVFTKILVPKYGFPMPKKWQCTAALCRVFQIPAKLAKACQYMGLKHQKDAIGKKLIQEFLVPDKDSYFKPLLTSRDELALLDYCMKDVASTREIYVALYSRLMSCKDQVKFYDTYLGLDDDMNTRGLSIDVKLCEKLDAVCEVQEKKLFDKFYNAKVDTPVNLYAPADLKEGLKRAGVLLADTQRPTLAALDLTKLAKPAADLIRARLTVTRPGPKKVPAILDNLVDGKVYSLMLLYGAHTGRWSGVGIQVHNFPHKILGKKHKETLDLLEKLQNKRALPKGMNYADVVSDLVPACLIPDKKKVMIKADFSAIEARIVFWLAGQEDALKAYREKADIYKQFASYIFQKDVSSITFQERFIAKQAVLGCGYGMGPERFAATVNKFGVLEKPLDESTAKHYVMKYRTGYGQVLRLWNKLESKFGLALNSETPPSSKPPFFKDEKGQKGTLYCVLPSRRQIYYNNCSFRYNEGFVGEVTAFGNVRKTHFYGGKFLENIAQATAGDLLVNACVNLPSWIEKLFTVHDELVCQVPKERAKEAKEVIYKAFTTPPEWASDLPLDAEVEIVRRYSKS